MAQGSVRPAFSTRGIAQAYQLGIIAGKKGKPLDHNPYSQATAFIHHRAWLDGYKLYEDVFKVHEPEESEVQE